MAAERFNIYLSSGRRQVYSVWVICLILLPGLACPLEKASEDELALVDVAALIPGVALDIRYATKNNFTKHILYSRARCYLLAPVARKLAEVQGVLTRRGLGLKIFDCYRPLSVQKHLWNLVPDERYVADPKKGSRHNRGVAVDVSLVDASGRELPMPTDYDDFTERAHRDYMPLPVAAIKNRALLETIMQQHGFEGFTDGMVAFRFQGMGTISCLGSTYRLIALTGPRDRPESVGPLPFHAYHEIRFTHTLLSRELLSADSRHPLGFLVR